MVKNLDLTVERTEDEKASIIARNTEGDNIDRNSESRKVSGPEGDDAAENKVATSIDDE